MAVHYQAPIRRKTPAVFRYGPFIFLGTMLVLASFSTWTGIGKMTVQQEAAVERMAIQFVDEADGGIGVYDPETKALIHTYPPNSEGFVRTALRALSFDRKKFGVGPTPAFELVRTESGQVILNDPSTQKFVTLEAFGASNAESFIQLFEKQPGGNS
ncbi:MAG: photosynthetic complex assembly protein PuhC [Pseudomonadota bacterium]